MITSEALSSATLPNPKSRVQPVPPQYEGIKAVRMDDHDDTNVIAKDGLMAQWLAKPTGSASHYADLAYSKATRRGWHKAKEEDIVSCLVSYDTERNGFFYGDLILVVAPRELVLGWQLDSYQRANNRVGIIFQDNANRTAQLGLQNLQAGGENTIRQSPETKISLSTTAGIRAPQK